MSIAGEIGGLLGGMVGVLADPVFIVAAVTMVAAAYNRVWWALAIVPALTVAVVAGINWRFWTNFENGPEHAVTGLLKSYYAWAVVILAVGALAHKLRGP